MKETKYNVVIIGAGVSGCSVARELSRWDLKIGVVEREEDVCSGTSKANSAIVHAGFDAEPGSLKARFNVEGNRMMEKLSQDLDVEFKRNGSLVLSFHADAHSALENLYNKGQKNGVPGLKIISGDEVRKIEPNVTDEVVEALYAPTGGIICPFGLTIAMAENACDNGVEFLFNRKVQKIRRTETGYILETQNGMILADVVVNAAGIYADELHNMVSEKKLHITPRKGDYCLLDKEAGTHVSHTIFQLPTRMGKGILVTPTIHGNLLLGPTARDIEDKEATATTADGVSEIMEKSCLGVKKIPFRQVITSFSGLRAHEEGDDFIIGEADDAPGFYDVAGIESPGLTSAPAIGAWLAGEIAKKTGAVPKEKWNGKRKGFVRLAELNYEERALLIKKRPDYGVIVCRCEGISEGEIRDAINRTPGAVSLDGIKRRVRQGMGRCQAGFCTPRTMEILAEERGIQMEDICKNGPGSQMLEGRNKGGR